MTPEREENFLLPSSIMRKMRASDHGEKSLIKFMINQPILTARGVNKDKDGC